MVGIRLCGVPPPLLKGRRPRISFCSRRYSSSSYFMYPTGMPWIEAVFPRYGPGIPGCTAVPRPLSSRRGYLVVYDSFGLDVNSDGSAICDSYLGEGGGLTATCTISRCRRLGFALRRSPSVGRMTRGTHCLRFFPHETTLKPRVTIAVVGAGIDSSSEVLLNPLAAALGRHFFRTGRVWAPSLNLAVMF